MSTGIPLHNTSPVLGERGQEFRTEVTEVSHRDHGEIPNFSVPFVLKRFGSCHVKTLRELCVKSPETALHLSLS
jgi:hypothetical protein